MIVGIVERGADIAGDSERVVHRELLFPHEPLAERFTLDVGHDVPELSHGLARVEKRENVWVLQPGGELDLPEEALRSQGGGQLRTKHLQGDMSAVLQVMREVNSGHSAPAEFPLDDIAVGQVGLETHIEARQGRTHVGLSLYASWISGGTSGFIKEAPPSA